jgi:hypothetical protein
MLNIKHKYFSVAPKVSIERALFAEIALSHVAIQKGWPS